MPDIQDSIIKHGGWKDGRCPHRTGIHACMLRSKTRLPHCNRVVWCEQEGNEPTRCKVRNAEQRRREREDTIN